MRKHYIIMLVVIMPFLITSCKKELPVADFSYVLKNHYTYTNTYWGQVDYVTVSVSNYSYNANSYSWQLTFPNGTTLTSTEYLPTFVCNITGNYELKLTARNDEGENTSSQTFFIEIEYSGDNDNPDEPDNPITPPTASFNINSSNGIYAPSNIHCNNTSVNATHYQWTLVCPDNTSATSTSVNPTFACTQSGTYTVQLIAYNSENQSSTSTMTFSLTAPSTFTITYLRLEDIPMTDTDHSSWDTGLFGGADPDIVFKILNSSSSVLYTSSRKDDIGESDLPVTWNNVNKTLNYSGNYSIWFYDYDDGMDSHDIMVRCNLPTSNITPGSSSFTWFNNDAGVRFVIGLTWQ